MKTTTNATHCPGFCRNADTTTMRLLFVTVWGWRLASTHVVLGACIEGGPHMRAVLCDAKCDPAVSGGRGYYRCTLLDGGNAHQWHQPIAVAWQGAPRCVTRATPHKVNRHGAYYGQPEACDLG